MARHEQDREDLLAEATALVERAEWSLPDSDDPVVVGFRKDGSPSIYFGADPVYQFNRQGQLRRAYVDGRMIKAIDGRLISLTRCRTEREVQLVRHDLEDFETAALQEAMIARLERLGQILTRGDFEVVGQVSENVNVAKQFGALIPKLIAASIAREPNLR